MDEKIAKAPKDVLVEIVKLAQKRKMKGCRGEWKEFLNFYDRKLGNSISDPSRRSTDVLTAFLKTFTEDNDLKFFAQVLQLDSKRGALDQFEKKSSDGESPEQRLVRSTLEHPMYPSDYLFPSHEEDWLVTKLRKTSKLRRSNDMVAVDCEMVLCEDGTEALVRVCIVDRNLKVKLSELVNPNKAVADYRTAITGITAKDLDGVTCSLADVQKSMKKLLSHGTILVGHSLHNDLQALKLDHTRVIDTSLIFKTLDGRRLSLNNLCKFVLGYEVRKMGAPHNCLDDACAAMKLVLAKIERGIDNNIPLVCEVPESERAKLLLHRIPSYVGWKDLHRIIPGNCTLKRQESKKAGGEKYSALAIFKSSEEANQAYEKFKGDQEKDSSGRPQKFVSFQLSTGATASLLVRKMTHDESVDQDLSKKRALQVEESPIELKKVKPDQDVEDEKMESPTPRESKRVKTDQKVEEEKMAESNKCCDHVKEIEKLNEVLKQRDQEISILHKIISNLTRKQGL